jgi:hypothetical protein
MLAIRVGNDNGAAADSPNEPASIAVRKGMKLKIDGEAV